MKDFLHNNKKSVASFAAVFAVGIIAGIFITINASGGEFERVARADMEFGAVKVFFSTSFMLLLGYGVILLSAAAPALVFAGLVSFGVLGIYFGKYACLLFACYGVTGVINFFVIYLPFFAVTFLLFVVAGAQAVNAKGCNRLKNSAFFILKIFGLNAGCDFVIFIIIGAFAKVIVVGF